MNRDGAIHGLLHNAGDIKEAYTPSQKTRHRNLVRSIKNSRSRPTCLQGLPGQPKGWEALWIGGFEAKRAKSGQIQPR